MACRLCRAFNRGANIVFNYPQASYGWTQPMSSGLEGRLVVQRTARVSIFSSKSEMSYTTLNLFYYSEICNFLFPKQ